MRVKSVAWKLTVSSTLTLILPHSLSGAPADTKPKGFPGEENVDGAGIRGGDRCGLKAKAVHRLSLSPPLHAHKLTYHPRHASFLWALPPGPGKEWLGAGNSELASVNYILLLSRGRQAKVQERATRVVPREGGGTHSLRAPGTERPVIFA